MHTGDAGKDKFDAHRIQTYALATLLEPRTMASPLPFDDLVAAIAVHTQALAAHDRQAFVNDVITELKSVSEVGPGRSRAPCSAPVGPFPH